MLELILIRFKGKNMPSPINRRIIGPILIISLGIILILGVILWVLMVNSPQTVAQGLGPYNPITHIHLMVRILLQRVF